MAEFEVQMTVESFLAAQLRALQATRICLPPPVPLGRFSIQLQRIEFGPNEIRHHERETFAVNYRDSRKNPEFPHLTLTTLPADGFRTQIAQQVTLELSETGVIMSSPNAEPPPLIPPITLTLVRDLYYHPAAFGNCVLNTYHSHTEWPSGPPLLPAWVPLDDLQRTIDDFLRSMLVHKSIDFNFVIKDLLPEGFPEIANAGVSVDTTLSRIAFRVEPLGRADDNEQRWTVFYHGNIADHVLDADWVMFVDGGMLEHKLTTEIEKTFQKTEDDLFTLRGVSSRYWADGEIPRVDTTLDGVLRVPLVPDVEVSPRARFSFAIELPDRFVVDIELNEFHQLATALLGLGQTLVPGLDFVFELATGTSLSETIGDVVAGVEPDLGDSFPCVRVTPTRHRCTQSIPAPSIPGMAMRITGCRGLPAGMTITGALPGRPLTPARLAVEASEFAWVPPKVSCSQASNHLLQDVQKDPQRAALLYAEVALDNEGTTPVYVCGVEVVQDPDGVYPTGAPGLVVQRDLLPTKLTVRTTAPTYSAEPYPLRIVVRTTAGIRLVEVPPPPPFTPEAAAVVVSGVQVQLRACRPVPEWFGDALHGRFDLGWIVDPLIDPPGDLMLGQRYELLLQGLKPGHAVSLKVPSGETVLHTVTHPGVPLRLSALVAGPGLRRLSHRDLTLRHHTPVRATSGILDADPSGRNGNGDGMDLDGTAVDGASSDGGGIVIQQQALWAACSLPVPSPCHRLIPSAPWSATGIVAALDDGVTAFDLTNPHQPSRIGMWTKPGLWATCVWQRTLLMWGADGLTAVDGGLDVVVIQQGHRWESIQGAIAGENVLYLLTAERLELRSGPHLDLIDQVPAPGGACLQLVAGRLFVGGRSGLTVYDISDEHHPRTVDVRKELDTTEILVPYDAEEGEVLAVLADGRATTVRLVDGRLEDVVTYSAPPRWAGGVRVGRVLTQIGDGDMRLHVGVLGEQRLVVPEQFEGHP
ncbi:hypothetical protein ACIBF5_32180 [Micromonospora sp. NPDC050417]|uniref:hypothetical protein n=1 Tax=Micromonospora sp. NPDC050417 TaxID=3364280 RepID=UPI003787B25A